MFYITDFQTHFNFKIIGFIFYILFGWIFGWIGELDENMSGEKFEDYVKEVLKKNPFLLDDSALHIEDQEIGYRLSSLGYNIRVMNDFLIYYRKNEAGICFTYRDEQKERSYFLAKKEWFNNKKLINYFTTSTN